jgi:hypothetical protein
MTDLNLLRPDFSRLPSDAVQVWRRLTTSKAIERVLELGLTPEQDAALAAQLANDVDQFGTQSKSAAALAAENLSPAEDEFTAMFVADFAKLGRLLAARFQQ